MQNACFYASTDFRCENLNIYAKYQKYDIPEDQTSWLGKFYSGREDRIEQDLPYAPIDFEAIVAKAKTL